jgi:hydroxypyruvate isomerase
MPRFSANLSWLFQDSALNTRLSAAASAGFRAIEFNMPYDEYDAQELAGMCERSDVSVVLLNAPPGDWAAGDRGLAGLPDRADEFRESIDVAARYARTLRCPMVHVLAGIRHDNFSRETLVENLTMAVDVLASSGVQTVIEVLNPRDVPNYSVNHGDIALEIIDQIPGLGLLAELYHLQICQGDLSTFLSDHIDVIRHVQIASVPDRHEPDHGEINFTEVLHHLDHLGYQGWVGCEYAPRIKTEAGLSWVRQYL